jgi:hypothetical protein
VATCHACPRNDSAATVRRIAGFFRPYRGRVALVLLTIVVTSLLGWSTHSY